MATLINAVTSAGGGLAVTGDSSGVLGFQSAGTTYMTMDASGNLGLGTNSPSAFGGANFHVYSSSSYSSVLVQGGTTTLEMLANSGNGTSSIGTRSNTALNLVTNDTIRATIDTSGNVGIGTSTTNPAGFGKGVNLDGTSNVGYQVSVGGTFTGYFGAYTSETRIGSISTYPMTFYTNSTERMRIDSSGNVLVGTISKPASISNSGILYAGGGVAPGTGFYCKAGAAATTFGNLFNLNYTTGTQLWIDTTNTGTITVSSDYRIKKNIITQSLPAIERIAQIRPVTYEYADYEPFKWKADGIAREGFIAHELQAIIPSAVEGEKDAEHQIQSLKLDALCSVMVKAIQEQQELIKQLQADVAALKGGK